MAVKDHSLDGKIVRAATDEFMEHGFRGASLRQIARRAGLTTGALYTRYRNKDVLFSSLVASAWEEIGAQLGGIRQSYREVQLSRSPEQFMEAIRREEQIFLEVLFRWYDPCVLLICRSGGSSVQKQLEQLMEQKAKQTIGFFRTIARTDVDYDGLELILSEQFRYYSGILERGYDREKAISCMKTVENFMEAGWRDLFRRIQG